MTTPEAIQPTAFDLIITAIRGATTRALGEISNDVFKVQTAEVLFTEANGIRPYLISDAAQIKQIWAAFRANEVFVDFLLGATSEMIFRLRLQSITFDDLIEVATESFGIYSSDEMSNSAMDEDILDLTPTSEELRLLYKNNPWFLYLTLIQFTGMISEIIERAQNLEETAKE